MRRWLRLLPIVVVLVLGVLLLLLAYAHPPQSCCNRTSNGMNECTACAYSFLTSPDFVFLGVGTLLIGLVWLVISVGRRARPAL